MALTKVSGHVIDQPFDVGIITATNSYVSGIGTFGNIRVTGIGTFGNIRVTGDLQVDGTTTTLDTVVTEVDRLEVGANNSTVGVAITQSGSGDAAIFMGGNVGIATASPRQKLDVEGNINVVGIVTATTFVGNITGGSTADFSIADKIVHTGDTNTAIRFPAADTFSIETDGSEALRVDSSQRLLVNKTTSTTSNGHSILQVASTSNDRAIAIHNFENDANGPFISLGKSRGTSVNSYTIVQDNDELGNIDFFGADGTDFSTIGARIQAEVDGTPGTNDLPGRLIFATTADEANSPTERLRITSDGKVRVPDNGKFTAGAGDDLKIFHDGTDSFVTNDTGQLILRVASVESALVAVPNGAVELYHNNVKKFETTSYGAKFSDNVLFNNPDTTGRNLTWEADNNALHWEDNTKATFGGGNDLQIFHDGSNNYILGSSGNIILKNSSSNYLLADTTTGAVELNYNDSKKFETTTTGISVTGSIQASQEYPSIRPTLDLNFAATKSLDRRITFTRGSLGTYTDENGVLRTASNNVARFDHDPTTGESLGLLIEEVQDNLINYSSEMNLWTKSNCNVTENAVTSPDGTLTADKIALSGVSGYVLRSLTISANSVHTYSVYMKKADNNFGMLRYRWNGSNYDTVNFDLVNGTTSRTPAGVSSTSIIDVGNGWYRCIVTFTPTSTTASNFQIKSSSEAQTSDGSSYTGTIDGVRGVYAWGAQVEQGSFASSYIPTSGSTGTRWSDKAKIIGTNFTDFYNQTEGTFSVTAKPNEPNNGSNYYFIFEAANYSNTGNAVSIGKDSGNTYRLRPMKHSNLSDSSVAYTTNSVNIAIAGSGSGDGVAVVNGTVSATSTGAPSGTQDHNVLQIGNRYPGSSGGHYSGTIQSLKYYNKRLPNAQLQGLTQQ